MFQTGFVLYQHINQLWPHYHQSFVTYRPMRNDFDVIVLYFKADKKRRYDFSVPANSSDTAVKRLVMQAVNNLKQC